MKKFIIVPLVFMMCLCIGCGRGDTEAPSRAISSEPTAALPASPQPMSTVAPEIIDTVSMDEGKPEQAADEIPPCIKRNGTDG